jgi:peptidoglycan/xylan/chitin deacetylase (PgdA/CDA1 family)
MEGIFTISLDFELHWGVFDKRDRQERENCYRNTLKYVPAMLEMFSKYGVHVTWATVGSLFAENEQEWRQLKPAIEPDYVNEKYSAYTWVNRNGLSEQYRWAHFAPDLVKRIPDYPFQELGTHTFSHYYCLEQLKGQDAFDADLKAARKAGQKFGNDPVSLVFPRNQFNPIHLKLCYQNGIRVVRTNPDIWFWEPIPDQKSDLLRKVFRTGDAYLPVGNKTSYSLDTIKRTADEPVQLPASRFLRSWNPSYNIANKLSLRRLIGEMDTAAKKKECYHLWWHPENFGDHPEENMSMLHIILENYKKNNLHYGMTSWNMGEYAGFFATS